MFMVAGVPGHPELAVVLERQFWEPLPSPGRHARKQPAISIGSAAMVHDHMSINASSGHELKRTVWKRAGAVARPCAST